jgi:hypothetical protein
MLPVLFRRLDKGLTPPSRAFEPGSLTRTASVVCKLSAILVQAYWLMAAIRKRKAEVPKRLNEHLLQIWAGNQTFTEGSAISILHDAAQLTPSVFSGRMVGDPAIFVLWGEHFLQKKPNLKSFLKSLRAEDWYLAFDRLVAAVPILKTTEFTGSGFVFEGEPELPVFPFLHRSLERGRNLYLYDFDKSGEKIIFEDPYSDYSEDLVLQDHPGLNERYLEIREILGLADIRENVLYLFGSGYKHIQRLAETIADDKNKSPLLSNLIQQAKSKRSDISDEMSDAEVMTLLLASDGPSRVLKQLLVDGTLFEKYLGNLEEKTHQSKEYWVRLYEEMLTRKRENFQGYLDLDHQLREETIPRFELELKSWCICKAAGFKINDPLDYVEGMGVKLAMLGNFVSAIQGRQNDQQNVLGFGNQIQKLVERTFRFLIVFYSGLRGYYDKLQQDDGSYQSCEKGLLQAARRAHRESHRSAGELIGQFMALCNSMNHKGPPDILLGRPVVCDLKAFGKLADAKWVSIFNRLKHDKSTGRVSGEVSNDEVMGFANQTIRIFNFLQYGERLFDLQDAVRKAMPIWQRVPTYPMVVSFREQHRIRDGLVTYSYRIHRSDGLGLDDKDSVNIMTPHEYMANEDYYCIPYHKRTTNKWLLDPFLIRCSKIDEILNEKVKPLDRGTESPATGSSPEGQN